MLKKLIARLIEWLTPMAYVPMTVDKVNKRLVQPLPGIPGFYKFVSAADMPEARFVHYLHLVKRLQMNVDAELLNRYLTVMEDAFNKSESGRFHGALFMLRDTMETISPVETYYWIAALMYFREDEDLTTFDYDVNKKKVEYFKSIPNQTFFLASLLKSLNSSGGQSLEEIENYLKDSQVKGSHYGRILTEMSNKK
jgi:hypothetical protein